MPSIEIAVAYQDNWYFDSVRDGIVEQAEAAGVQAAIVVEAPGAASRAAVLERFITALAAPDCIGAVAVGYEFTGQQVARLVEHGRPVVVVGGLCEGLPSVSTDDVAVAYAATRHLLDLGHVSIDHLAGNALSPDDFTMRVDRVRGYSDAMRDAGLDQNSHVVPCAFEYEAAYRAAREMLSRSDRPTAVFAVADELAFPVLDAARDLGLVVPRDLSVIGVDDRPGADGRGLTTFRQDTKALGRAAADRVLGVTDAERQVIQLELVERSTTARPGGDAPERRRDGWLSRVLRRGR